MRTQKSTKTIKIIRMAPTIGIRGKSGDDSPTGLEVSSKFSSEIKFSELWYKVSVSRTLGGLSGKETDQAPYSSHMDWIPS